MGVLEDAIREHIELRRRHGAAEDELLNQEAEALGPARREVDSAEQGAQASAPDEPAEEPTRLVEAPVFEEPEPEVPLHAPGEREDEPVASLDPGEPLNAAPLEEPVTEMGSPFDEQSSHVPPLEELAPDELPPDELPPEELPPEELPPEELAPDELAPEELPPEELPPEEDPPEEDPPAAAPPPAAEDADDDVLEETPDFLSETPEHDRLWFEQKPPRDFDFD